jgi:hypothetical protein
MNGSPLPTETHPGLRPPLGRLRDRSHRLRPFKFSADEKLSGWDYTVGPSGACGANKWLVIEMPFKLVKTG